MEHTTEASIMKVLLDYSEYERLRHIETQYIELNRQHKEKLTQHHSSFNQIGQGDNDLPTTSNQLGCGNNESPHLVPPIANHEPNIEKLTPINYNVTIKKEDLNSAFDEKKLLSFVPKTNIKTAQYLLKEFDKRGDELTWNSSGIIFIDRISIPQSNIYVLFPLLFKKKGIKHPGFDEFVQKIYDMGLGDLVKAQPSLESYNVNEITGGSENNLMSPKSEDNTNIPWWYIGD